MSLDYKQHTAADDKLGVILNVAVTTGAKNEGEMIAPQVDEVKATTGINIKTITADAGYAYAKVYGALERRGIDALIPAKAEPIRSRVPMRRFRCDAKHDILKCPRGRVLRPNSAREARSLLLLQGEGLRALSVKGRLPVERTSEQSRRGRRRLSRADQGAAPS